ncbi:MAG: GGDEF domain-containing protein [Gammaproteobacteria bacterium]
MDENENDFIKDEALAFRLAICPDLPSPPGVALQIISLGQDPEVDLGEIAEVVSRDPVLSAKMLRIANSPAYARHRKVENLRQAIVTFGLNGTRTLALSFSLVDALRARSGDGFDHNLYWRRSLAAANACQNLGEFAGAHNAEEFFLCGLFQDIGMLALDAVMPDLYRDQRALQPDHAGLSEVELAVLGSDHADVGAWLLASWRLPEHWVWAVAASHGPDAMEVSEEYLPLARCVTLAGNIADIWWSNDPQAALGLASERAAAWFDMDHAALAVLVESVAQETVQSAEIFDIDLGDAVLMESLMDQAREMMMVRNLRVLQVAEGLNHATQSLESRARDLEEQVKLDGLTGLYNRKHLDAALEKEFSSATAQGWPLALVLVDLDHFKLVNDKYGHQAGDEVLRQTATLLRACARDSDIVARYGGEEFVLLLPGTGLRGAQTVCKRLVEAFRETPLETGSDGDLVVTVSVGLTVQGEATHFSTTEEFIRAADLALYAAKAEGRDRVVVYSKKLSHFA